MKKVLSVAAVALALSATAAQAHEGLYVGGNFQMGNFNLEAPSDINANLKDAIGGKYSAATLNLVAGYDFNQYFAVEGRVGIPSSSETSSYGGLVTLEGKPKTSYALFGKGTLPITEMFSVYALAGVGASPYQVDLSYNIPTVGSGKETVNFDGVSLQYAAGVEVNFTQSIAMTAEYGMYGYGKKDIAGKEAKYDTTGFNIGLKYKF